MTKIAFIFPGQGSQQVGMGANFVEINEDNKAFYHRANEVLNFDLAQIMLQGPQEQLTLTYNAQPALLTTGVMIANLLEAQGITPHYTAGHSLGEYSAFVASGVLSFEEAVRIVHKRGLFMEKAVPAGKGAMAAVLAFGAEQLQAICSEVTQSGQVVEIANYNCPGQIVISGTKEGVAQAGLLAKQQGAKRVLPLVVSGPFHSQLMKEAAEQLAIEVEQLTIQQPRIPVVSNVSSNLLQSMEEIKVEMVQQVTSSVQWQQNVEALIAQGVTVFIECGPGKVLSSLVKKISKDVSTYCVYDEASLNEVLEASKGWTQWV